MRSAIDEYIIDKVWEIRNSKDITQEAIAIHLGHESNAYIGSIESVAASSTKCYNSKHLNQIAALLGCSPKDFWPDHTLNYYQPIRNIQSGKVSTKKRSKKKKADK
ncbi:MAG TPA: helix-turn-helix transcriptional regulator [Phnomibacter sp.]|nr:helix-turn-helix transcriptional regulator [Phnomibacter sp.]